MKGQIKECQGSGEGGRKRKEWKYGDEEEQEPE